MFPDPGNKMMKRDNVIFIDFVTIGKETDRVKKNIEYKEQEAKAK